jgi:hypothetical protein
MVINEVTVEVQLAETSPASFMTLDSSTDFMENLYRFS